MLHSQFSMTKGDAARPAAPNKSLFPNLPMRVDAGGWSQLQSPVFLASVFERRRYRDAFRRDQAADVPRAAAKKTAEERGGEGAGAGAGRTRLKATW